MFRASSKGLNRGFFPALASRKQQRNQGSVPFQFKV